MKLGFRIQNNFFDRLHVIKGVDKGTRQVLGKFGGRVRLKARDLTKRKPKTPRDLVTAKGKQRHRPGVPQKEDTARISKPGRPPFSHLGLIHDFIWFAWDPQSRSVVIGPISLSGSGRTGEAPEILEFGGDTTIRIGSRRKKRSVNATYRARPYMQPALANKLPELPPMWQNSVKGP